MRSVFEAVTGEEKKEGDGYLCKQVDFAVLWSI